MHVPMPFLYWLAQVFLHTWALQGLPGYRITQLGRLHRPADTFTVISVNLKRNKIVTGY
jgi:hypothetical protein